jgi:8-oxo-dGTP diphosphatase
MSPLTPPERRPEAAVGVVCLRGEDVLLVRRAKAPLAGQWSLPGGRVEWGERVREAALRELAEETGCAAELIGLADVVDALVAGTADEPEADAHFILIDFAARWLSGEPRAGDDAAEARFFTPEEIAGLGLWRETFNVIAAARALAADFAAKR